MALIRPCCVRTHALRARDGTVYSDGTRLQICSGAAIVCRQIGGVTQGLLLVRLTPESSERPG